MDGIIERIGKERSDIPWTENTLDPELVELVKDYHSNNRPTLLNLFRKYPEKQIIIFHTREEADEWLTKQKSEKYAY